VPIYEYRCPNGHVFELFQRFDDEPPEKCETCGAAPLERVLYPVAVHFKGSGFYSTDYGRGSGARKAAKDGDAAAGSEPGSEKGDKGDKSEKKEKAAEA
jgi:putative FmdB family regulatory protein